MRGNPATRQEFHSLGGFASLLKYILADENYIKTPIRLKLKALTFISYVWKEQETENDKEDNDSTIFNMAEVNQLCNLLVLDKRFYTERTNPFGEDDSIAWVDQMSEPLETFAKMCVSIWDMEQVNFKMLINWLEDAKKYLVHQVQQSQEGGDLEIMEYMQNILNRIKNILQAVLASHNMDDVKNVQRDEL